VTVPLPPFESAFKELIQTLEALPFPYCILGALALGIWGAPRTTQYLDVLVAVDEPDRTRLAQAFQDRQFLLDHRWAEDNPMIRAWHLRLQRGPIPVDLLLPRDPHDQMVLTRRQRQVLDQLSFWVISPEDFILHKLKTGRPRDFEDVLSVIIHQGPRLDLAYLRSWAERLGITEELTYCLEQPGQS
jgi:hypothetical protein